MRGKLAVVVGALVTAALICGCETGGAHDSGGSTRFSVGWNQLESGMNPVQVLSVLDEPTDVRITRVNTFWYYSDRGADGPHVVFGTRDMRVERWRAPHGE